MNIFVGNMSREVKKENLQDLFKDFGQIDSVTVLIDRIDGEWKAFSFVEMPNENEALDAIEALDGNDYLGQLLIVHQARFRTEDRREKGRYGGRRHTDLLEIK